MVTLPSSVKIYLALDPTDMRKQMDGLSAIVQGKWKVDPYSGHLFVFIGRRLDRVKILYFDHGGFVVFYKRLEAGKFRIPAVPTGSTRVQIEATDLQMLLHGIDFSRVRRDVPWMPREETMGTPPPQLDVDRGIRL